MPVDPPTTFMAFIKKTPDVAPAQMPAAVTPGESAWLKAISANPQTQATPQHMTLGAGAAALANWQRAIAPVKP